MSFLLAALVRLFPRGFRRRFGAELAAQVRRDYERAAAGGVLPALAHTVATGWDLVWSAVAEHVRPTWVVGPSDERREAGMMDGWMKDLGQAVRSLRRAPGFTVVAVGTLGLAIGANAGIFSVVDSVLLRPMPYPDADRLVYIASSAPGTDYPEEFGVSYEFQVEYSEKSELLEGVAAYSTFTNTLRTEDRAERIRMAVGAMPLLHTLGTAPVLGRLPGADEEGVVVISHALWTTWFGADPAVLGRSVNAAGGSRTIVGVMGPDFWFPEPRTLLWIPNTVRVENVRPGRFGAGMVGRLAPGATQEALVDELALLAAGLPERFGGSPAYARLIDQYVPVVRPLREQTLGALRGPLLVLFAAVAMVLLIACGNVANLFMVRAEARQRDLAVRRAMGAGRRQLLRVQLAEAVVLAALAGPLAVLLARVSVPLLLQAAPEGIPGLDRVGLGVGTVAFTVLACALSALLCGLGPALRASAPNLARLRDEARGSTTGRNWPRNALVAGQTALAMVLLVGSGLLVRSWTTLRSVDPGYDVEDVFTFQIAPESDDLVDGPSYARFHLAFMERLRALPGVESVGLIENVPLNEGTAGMRFRSEDTPDEEDAGIQLDFTYSAGDYFPTMGIAVIRGRTFVRADHESEPGNVVLSRSAAELLWPGQDPLGRRVQRAGTDAWHTVVGVVDDVIQLEFRERPQALVYFPLAGHEPMDWVLSSPAWVLKTARAEVIAPEVRALVREVAPGAPMYRVYTMEGLVDTSMATLSFTTLTLGIASVLALILGAVGLYGVLAYVVAGRRREIGVRMALGAEARRVQAMVVAQGARVVVVGVIAGVGVSLLATRALGTLLFGVQAFDAVTFGAGATAMLLVGFLASWIPAHRASTVDPVQSLRGD